MTEQSGERIILVNMQDEEIGLAEKLEAHEKGLLHRAFSVFVFNGSRLLMQRRAAGKYHSAGLWTNTCCSHPRVGERTNDAARRRLLEEASVDLQPKEVGNFIYRVVFDNGLTEYEYDHVYIAEYDGPFCPNPEEAEEMCWREISEIKAELRTTPQYFAAWFPTAFSLALSHHRQADNSEKPLYTVATFLQCLRDMNLNELLDIRTVDSFRNLEARYGQRLTPLIIIEVNMGAMERTGDFSFCMSCLPVGLLSYSWLECDASEYSTPDFMPNWFVNAMSVMPGKDNDTFFLRDLAPLAGQERVERLLPQFRRVLAALKGKARNLFQIGSMDGRREDDSLRVYVCALSSVDLLAFLEQMHWSGDFDHLAAVLRECEGIVFKNRFTFCFDVMENGIGPKIGVELHPVTKTPKSAELILDYLVQHGLCLRPKRKDVMRFLTESTPPSPLIKSQISHFKLTLENDRINSAKAYLELRNGHDK